MATASMAATLGVIVLLGFAAAPTTRADIPESELKLAGAIPLTTELLDRVEKFFANARSDAAAKAELATVTKENKDNPPMTGEAWASLISAKCPKAVGILEGLSLTPDDLGKAVFAMQSLIWIDGLATPEDKDKLAKSEDKVAAANAVFFTANKARAETVVANFTILGLQ